MFFEGLGYHSLGRYEEAITALDDASVRSWKKTLPLALLAVTSADMGRMDEARVAVQAVLRVNPKFSAKGFVNGPEADGSLAKALRASSAARARFCARLSL